MLCSQYSLTELAYLCLNMIVVTPEDIEYQKVHENDDRTTILYTTAATMIVFPGIAVVLRLACRYNLKAPISHDDVAIIVALVSIGKDSENPSFER